MRKIDVIRCRQLNQRKQQKEHRKRKRERHLQQVLRAIRRRLKAPRRDMYHSRMKDLISNLGVTRNEITEAGLERLFSPRERSPILFRL